MTETLANGYSSESTQRELSNEYQHDRVKMFFKNLCVFLFRMKVASALEGLKGKNHNIIIYFVVIFLVKKLTRSLHEMMFIYLVDYIYQCCNTSKYPYV